MTESHTATRPETEMPEDYAPSSEGTQPNPEEHLRDVDEPVTAPRFWGAFYLLAALGVSVLVLGWTMFALYALIAD